MVAGGMPLHWLDAHPRATIRWRCTACRCRSARPTRSTWTYLDAPEGAGRARRARCGSPTICASPACAGMNMHDLLPLPYTEEALRPRRRARACRCRIGLGRRLVLENVSSYVTFATPRAQRMGVHRRARAAAPTASSCSTSTTSMSAPSTTNFDAHDFLRGDAARRASRQFHLAGHSTQGQPHHRHPRPSDLSPACGSSIAEAVQPFSAGADHDRARRRHPALCRAAGRARRARGIAAGVARSGRARAPDTNVANVGLARAICSAPSRITCWRAATALRPQVRDTARPTGPPCSTSIATAMRCA